MTKNPFASASELDYTEDPYRRVSGRGIFSEIENLKSYITQNRHSREELEQADNLIKLFNKQSKAVCLSYLQVVMDKSHKKEGRVRDQIRRLITLFESLVKEEK